MPAIGVNVTNAASGASITIVKNGPVYPLSGMISSGFYSLFNYVGGHAAHIGGGAQSVLNAKAFMNDNSINLATATTFNVADLRLAFQIQKFLERNARAGARYTEFLRSHFGVSPRDERLQRPEYIGGSKAPVIISEVLQTGSSDATSPQGNMAGHGISVNSQYCG